MYFRRLKIFLAMVGVVLAVWVVRLAVLQLLRGDDYLRQARENLIKPPVSLPTERGRIVDRNGLVLAIDEAETGVAVEYGILADNPWFIATGSYRVSVSRAKAVELAEPRRQRYAGLLAGIAELCGVAPADLDNRRQEIIRQVAAIRASVSRRAGRDTPIPAERMPHVLIRDIDPVARMKVETLLSKSGDLPGISIASMRRRSYPTGKLPDSPQSLAHLVGYEGAVSAEDLADDPFADDDRRRYLPGDDRGLAGVERSAEAVLRGWRGRFQDDRDGNVLLNEPAVFGGTVRLSIDSRLQNHLFHVLARHVEASPYPCGGAIVVINIGTNTVGGRTVEDGDVLALVSYPSFDPNRWRDKWEQMNNDARRRPLLFRAIGEIYPPGSIVKPAVVASALHDGKVRLDETIDCTGFLISREYKAFHCWAEYGHGQPLSPSDALKFSCNVYCYVLGQRLGLGRLTWWLGRFGIGQDLGAGLAEERRGVLPTPLWVALNRGGGHSLGDARNVAIGQGDLRVTPLAAANMMATIARNGVFVRPTIVLGGPRPERVSLDLDPAHMAAVRDGLVRVVNEEGGTAHKYAFMDNVKLAGKTGSATASRIRVDGDWLPPLNLTDKRGKPTKPAHAWFAGFAPADRPTVAIACVIEYGMSGGECAGPLGRDVVQVCLNEGYLPHSPEDVRPVEGTPQQ